METDANKTAIDFLLGKLGEEDQSIIEERFFRDTPPFEDILIAENDLIDDYVLGRLSLEDSLLFERRLLINPRQRQRAAFAGTLIKYASGMPVEVDGLSASSSGPAAFFARIFSGQPLFSYSLATAAVLLFLGALFWWTSFLSRPPADVELAQTSSQAETESQRHAPDRQVPELGRPPEPSNSDLGTNTGPNARRESNTSLIHQSTPKPIISTIVLLPGSTRDVQSAKTFLIPKKTDLLNFQLKFEDGKFASYFAVLETADGQQIWRGKVTGYREDKDGGSIRLAIPAKCIKGGDYVVSLKGQVENGAFESVADYSFSVAR